MPLKLVGRSSRPQKINMEIITLNVTLDQMDLIDIYVTFHPTSTEYIFYKCIQKILQNRSYIRQKNKPS